MTEQNVEKKTSFIRRYNVIPKIICILAAFVIWIYVAQTETAETERTFSGLTVNLDNSAVLVSDSGLYPYSGYGNVAEVTVSGRKNVIRDFTADDLRVFVDLSEVTEAGDSELKLKVSLRDGMTLKSISPETITVHFDNKVTKDIEVTVGNVTSGGVENDYSVVYAPQFTTVAVKGPQKIVDDIARAVVDPDFGTERLKNSVSVTTSIRFESFSGSEIDVRDLEFTPQIKVTASLETTKTVPVGVAFKYGYLTDDNVTVSPESVTLKGDPAILAAITRLEVGTVDEKNVSTDETLTFELKAPESVEIVDGVAQASVFVELPEDTVTRVYTVDTFTVNGANGMPFEIVTESLRVSVRGSLADLGKVTSEDISAVVDLSGQSETYPGSVKLKVRLSLPVDSVYEVGEYEVEVIIGSGS